MNYDEKFDEIAELIRDGETERARDLFDLVVEEADASDDD